MSTLPENTLRNWSVSTKYEANSSLSSSATRSPNDVLAKMSCLIMEALHDTVLGRHETARHSKSRVREQLARTLNSNLGCGPVLESLLASAPECNVQAGSDES